MATSPTQRTLALCKRHGWECAVTERWNPFAKVRQDLFGAIDIVCLTGTDIIGIQVTSGSNVAARITKIKAEPRAKAWIESGGRLFVHGWRKVGGKWDCREVELFTEDFGGTT